MKRVLKEKLSPKQTERVRALAERLANEFRLGCADWETLMIAEGVVYDIQRIIYRQLKRR